MTARLQVRDFRNDVILAEACRQDVDKYCGSVKPGEGKVHQCLVDHQDNLAVACRAETNHLSITAASNVELSPSLGKACAAERQAHCKGVTPGKARVFNCLLANADRVSLTSSCSLSLCAIVLAMQRLQHVFLTVLKLAAYHLTELVSDMLFVYKVCTSTIPSHICLLIHSAAPQSGVPGAAGSAWGKYCAFPDIWLTLSAAVQMNMTTTCRSNLLATQESRLRNWRLDYGVRKQCKEDVSKVIHTSAADSSNCATLIPSRFCSP